MSTELRKKTSRGMPADRRIEKIAANNVLSCRGDSGEFCKCVKVSKPTILPTTIKE
jgi:hypothetical protein